MFALRVEFLTGRYVAKETHDTVEWPPHPARLFSALVAAMHASLAEGEAPDAGELAALQWLQGLEAPRLTCSEKRERAVVTHYVPVNSSKTIAALERYLGPGYWETASARPSRATITPDVLTGAAQLLPEGRGIAKKERTFPTLIPDDPIVFFQWPASLEEYRGSLKALASRVAYLGHSSSLVAVSVEETNLPNPTLEPRRAGPWKLRGIGTNQFAALTECYKVNERALNRPEQSYRLPYDAVSYGHRRSARAESPQSQNVFGSDWVVFRRVGGPEVPVRATLDVTHALRRAVLDRLNRLPISDRAREFLTGLTRDNKRLDGPHVAWLALPWVNHPQATGRLLGVAAVLPAQLDKPELWELADEVLRALDIGADLDLPTVGRWRIEPAPPGEARSTLDPETWCRLAQRWATVTPVVLDRFPGHLFGRAARTLAQLETRDHSQHEAEDTIALACTRIGLPRPTTVRLGKISPVHGTLPAYAFPPMHAFRPPPPKPGAPKRWHVHALIEFAEAVRGPVLVGAGRYFGYGLCRPLFESYT